MREVRWFVVASGVNQWVAREAAGTEPRWSVSFTRAYPSTVAVPYAAQWNLRAFRLSGTSMPIRSRWMLAVLLVVAPIVCGAEPAPNAAVEGTVTDGGKPVADAVVAMGRGAAAGAAARAIHDLGRRSRLPGGPRSRDG